MNHVQFAVTRYFFTIYLAPAVAVSYFSVWLDLHGFDQTDIASLNALVLVGILLFSTTAGRWADRLPDWRTAVIAGSGLSAVLGGLLFVSDHKTWIFIIWILASLPIALSIPIADAATMRKASNGGFSFGTVRAWATIGHVIMCFVAGACLNYWGADAFLPLFFALGVVRAIAAVGLPPLRDSVTQSIRKPGLFVSRELLASLPLWVILPLIAGAAVLASHVALGAFVALIWKGQGLNEVTIGSLIAVGALAEAICMFYFKSIQQYFSARVIILIAALATALRWGAMSFDPPLWLLFLLQLTHAVTFAFSYLGCLYFVTNRVPEDFTAEAQSLFAVVQQLLSIISLMVFGYWLEQVGSLAFLFNMGMCVVAIVMVWWSLRMHAVQAH